MLAEASPDVDVAVMWEEEKKFEPVEEKKIEQMHGEKVGSSLKIQGSLNRYTNGDKIFGVKDDMA